MESELDEILVRVYNGDQNFTEGELNDLAMEYEDYCVDTIEGEHRRWLQGMETILKVKDKYFSIYWDRGLTENQENQFDNQPVEVNLHEEQIVRTKRTYTPVK